MLSIVPVLLFIDCVRDFGCLSVKVEVLAQWLFRCGGSGICPTKRSIVKVIVGFVELVAETVIRIIKVDPNDSGSISRSRCEVAGLHLRIVIFILQPTVLRDRSKRIRSSPKAWSFIGMSATSWDCRIKSKKRHAQD